MNCIHKQSKLYGQWYFILILTNGRLVSCKSIQAAYERTVILAVLEESIIPCRHPIPKRRNLFMMCTKTFPVKTTKMLSIIPHEKSIDLFLRVGNIFFDNKDICERISYVWMLAVSLCCVSAWLYRCVYSFYIYAQISSNIPRKMRLTDDFLFVPFYLLFQML